MVHLKLLLCPLLISMQQSTLQLPTLRSPQPFPGHLRTRLYHANETLTQRNPNDIKRLLDQVVKFHSYHLLTPEDRDFLASFMGNVRQWGMHNGLGPDEFIRYYALVL